MTKNIFMTVSLFLSMSSAAMAQGAPSDVFTRINADCSTVKECACQEVCNDVCRVVNGQQVCDQSCKTICEYSTSGAESAASFTVKGNGSEACVTSCGDAADASCGDDAKCRSAYFRGCMRTCWM